MLWIAFACFTAGSTVGGYVLANLGTEMAPDVAPAMTIAIGTITAGATAVFVGLGGGWVVDHYGRAGYTVAFSAAALLACGAMLGYLLGVRKPAAPIR